MVHKDYHFGWGTIHGPRVLIRNRAHAGNSQAPLSVQVATPQPDERNGFCLLHCSLRGPAWTHLSIILYYIISLLLVVETIIVGYINHYGCGCPYLSSMIPLLLAVISHYCW